MLDTLDHKPLDDEDDENLSAIPSELADEARNNTRLKLAHAPGHEEPDDRELRMKEARGSVDAAIGTAESEDHQRLTSLDAVAGVIPPERWNAKPRHEESVPFPKLAAVYGEQIIDGELRACSLEDMITICNEIAARILVDEHSHAPRLTVAPYPHSGVTGKSNEALANNDRWLTIIKQGNWPIPASYKFDYASQRHSDELSRDPHDYSENHLVFMELAPREMQDQISETASIGIEHRLDTLDDPSGAKGLILAGELEDEIDPLAHSWRGPLRYGDINAIGVIDEISDDPSFPMLMEQLLELRSDEERAAYMDQYVPLARLANQSEARNILEQSAPAGTEFEISDWVGEELNKVSLIMSNMAMIVAITNFNIRHREGRNMTESEQSEAKDAYLKGLVRVADKLSASTKSGN